MATTEEHVERGSSAMAISNGVVRVMREYTGRGPTGARAVISRDEIMVVMSDTLTKGERQLVANGKQELVLQVRQEYQQAMREDLVALVEEISQRDVLAFMSANHIDPDMATETFILGPDEPESI